MLYPMMAYGAVTCNNNRVCDGSETITNCPADCTPASITWQTGILGHCPTVGGYVACCYDLGVCGLKIGGKCQPDSSIYSSSAYTKVVIYSADTKVNKGRCAPTGPTMNYYKACYANANGAVVDASNQSVQCIDPSVTPGTTLTSPYCTSSLLATRSFSPVGTSFDNTNLGNGWTATSIIQAPSPMTMGCRSFYVPTSIKYGQMADMLCACPGGCSNVCQSSYYLVASPVTVVDATCSDTYLNNLETDNDCGGNNCRATSKCAVGKVCAINSDCVSNNCEAGVCKAAPSCSDTIKNGLETDVDCGDGCPGCAVGKACAVNSDCASNFCDAGVCKAAATCTDVIKNQDETDVDCGGLVCPACADTKACLVNSDCESSNCNAGICMAGAAATCSDGILNQDEAGVDCGGSICPACAGCELSIKSWTDLYSLDKTEIATGLPIYVLLVGANCNGVNADFDIKRASDDSSIQAIVGSAFELDAESGSHFVLAEVDPTKLEVGSGYYYSATVHKALGDEVIGSKAEPNGILTVTGECHVADPGNCQQWYLGQAAPFNDPTLDADCDGMADCLDNWIYGNEELEPIPYIQEKVEGCMGSWNCGNSEWSKCSDVNGEYIATRIVRPCGEYDAPCCTPPGQICAPPPSKKVCIEEEDFPVFSWVNVLLVSMMLVSFYFYRSRRF